MEGATDILCLVTDPDSKRDLGSSLLESLPKDRVYKVCVAEDPRNDASKDPSDQNNAAYYRSRGFKEHISLPLVVNETFWEKGGTHNAIWLLSSPPEDSVGSVTSAELSASPSEAQSERF